jgi:hypothetical protein
MTATESYDYPKLEDDMKRLDLSFFLMVMVGCFAETPWEPPKRLFYENEPVTFNPPYDEVWLATVRAVEELKWDTENVNKGMGIIVLRTSYVYNTSFGKNERVYLEPKHDEIEH